MYKNAEYMSYMYDHIALRMGLGAPSSDHLLSDRRFNVKMSVGVQMQWRIQERGTERPPHLSPPPHSPLFLD